MTGFTYGPDAGATYGPDAGGTLGSDTAPTTQTGRVGGSYGPDAGMTYGPASGGQWSPFIAIYRVDGVPIRQLLSERATFDGLELSARVPASRIDDLDSLQRTAEKVQRVADAGGSFLTQDRSDTGGVVTVSPPGDRTPPREEHEALVRSYEQRALEQTQDAYEVDIGLVRRRDRGLAAGNDTRGTDEWRFVFDGGPVATDRVRFDPAEATETAADVYELTLILDPDQTATVEGGPRQLDAVSTREVPDGVNTTDDDSDGDVNTVEVTTPDGTDPIPDGTYVVREWTSTWLSSEGYRVELTLGRP